MTLPVQDVERTAQPSVGIGWRHSHYAGLLAQQPSVDFLEVHSENFFAQGGASLSVLQQGRVQYPISLHGVGLGLGSAAGIDPWHLDQLAALVERIDPVRVSDHACFSRGLYGTRLVHASDLLPIPFTSEALNVLCDNVDQVQSRLKRPILVENLSAYLSWRLPLDTPQWTEVEFLSSLARRTGCGLLVDVNNIYVNALNLARVGPIGDPEALCQVWLDAIAPAAVGELHLAGHCHVRSPNGDSDTEIVIDDHGSRVCDAVWHLYRYALQRFGPVPTLIEWDNDVPELDVLLDEAAHARAVAASPLQGVTA